MRRKEILILALLLGAAPLSSAQEPPVDEPVAGTETRSEPADGGPVLSEEISDEVIWSKDSPGGDSDQVFIPSEAISADAAIAFPVDI